MENFYNELYARWSIIWCLTHIPTKNTIHHVVVLRWLHHLSLFVSAGCLFRGSWKTELAHTLFPIHSAGFPNFIVTISCCLILMHVFFYLLGVLSPFFLLCFLPFCGCLPPVRRIYCVVDEPRWSLLVKILTPDNEWRINAVRF